MLWHQEEIRAVEIEAEFADGVLLIFNLDGKVVFAQNLFRQVQNVQEFLRGEAVVVIARLPQLKIGDGFGAFDAAAIDEMLGDEADLRHMEMRRQGGAVGQFEIDGRKPFQMLFQGREFHEVVLLRLWATSPFWFPARRPRGRPTHRSP